MALPSNVTYGTIVGRFLIATADSPADVDRDPEGIAATDLQITFSPNLSPAVARDPTATPPTFFALADVTATIGPDGSLIGPDGQPGVRLVASTNGALTPNGWTWAVRMVGTGYPTIRFSFLLDGGQTIDLGTVLQVPDNPGATLSAWLQAVADAQTARDAAIAAAASVPSAASLAATFLAVRATEPTEAERTAGVVAYVDKSVIPPVLKGWNGTAWVALGGSAAAAVSTVDNGDGTFTATGSGVTDNGDGTFTITDPTVTANADGTFSLAA